MNLRTWSLAAALALTTGLAAAAPSTCSLGTLTATYADGATASFLDCSGAWDGNLSPGTSAALAAIIEIEFGLTSSSYLGATGSAGNPFSNDPGAVASGVLQFASPFSGLFVLGLHSGDQNAPSYPGHPVGQGGDFSLYEFDGSVHGGVSWIAFDTRGVSVTNSGAGRNLSHAALYAESLPASTSLIARASEPGALGLQGLALAALLGLRLTARRRR